MAEHKHFYYLTTGAAPITAIYCPSERAWKRAMKKFKMGQQHYPTSHGSVTVFEPSNGGNKLHVMAFDNDVLSGLTDLQVIGLVVHECVHITQYIAVEMNDDSPSMEFQAYSVQCLTMDVLGAMKDADVFSL